jgi:hypothetical protein
MLLAPDLDEIHGERTVAPREPLAATSDQGMKALLSMRLRLIPGAGSSKTHSISSSFLSKKSRVAMTSSGGTSGGGGKSIRICSNDDGPSKAGGQSPVGGTAPAGVTAPAMGRQARMDTSSTRRAFILDPLCWAAGYETRHNHAPQTPGHVHLAGYSPTSVTRNSRLRRILGADLTVAGLVLPLAHAMPRSRTTFPIGQATNTCIPPAEDEAIERLLVRVTCVREGGPMIAALGGIGIVGIIVLVIVVLVILYFVRR